MQSKNPFAGKLNSVEAIQYITAGKATVTFKNSDTQGRYTYRIKRPAEDAPYFVSILKSGEWQFLGTVFKNDHTGLFTYYHGKKSRIDEEEQCAKVFPYVFNKLNQRKLPKVVEIWHEGKCGRCGRNLTVPESIKKGIGPECIKKLGTYIKR